MFETLGDKFSGIFDRLKKKGALNEKDVDAALREIRLALLDADVALPVVKDFIEKVRTRAVGEEVIRSVTPGQQVVHIVHDELAKMLGEAAPLDFRATPPVPILMVGLQGSGKTTTTARIGRYLTKEQNKRVLLASLDIYRPAAQEQLVTLGKSIDVAVLPPFMGEQPLAIAKRAMQTGRLEGYDIVILDTAGRLHIDLAMMSEVAQIKAEVKPHETLLVADALSGQDAATVAKEFSEQIGVTGLVLTRVDGDSRGGAALSMRHIANVPIKFMGVGEKPEDLEVFDAKRIADRILGMGDVVGLVEKAKSTMEEEDAQALAQKMMKGQFTLEDMQKQLEQVTKMGGLGGLMGMMPGVRKVKKQLEELDDGKMLKRQIAIIQSMTPAERRNPKILNASRRRRIAAGCGLGVPEVNRLLKAFAQQQQMMKKMKKHGKKGLGLPPGMMPPGGLGGGGMGGGGMPPFGNFGR
ncbi:MAG: signal recognition particle protein [Alphaproteobacteria bacterium]